MHALLSMFPLLLGLAMVQGWLQALDQWSGCFRSGVGIMLALGTRTGWACAHAALLSDFQSIDVGFSL